MPSRPTQQPTYYQQTRYVPVPVAQRAPRPYRHRDRDDDGDRHDWDKNGHWHS